MHSSPSAALPRRSSRVPVNLPILVTSLQPGSRFSEVCETLVVNAHGCAMRSPFKLDAGTVVHFQSKDGREATAMVLSCQPLDSDMHGWQLGARLDRPQNFWGLKSFPQDWRQITPAKSTSTKVQAKSGQTFRTIQAMPERIPTSLKAILEDLQKQVADERLLGLVASTMEPLRAEIAELREVVTRSQQKQPSKFEVSLSQIPPELEIQIEGRLRKELSPRVLDEARAQSAQLLEAAKLTIDKKNADTQSEFRSHVSAALESIEKQSQSAKADVLASMRDQLRREMGEFHQHVLGAGNRLQQLSHEILQEEQRTLAEEHSVRRQEFGELQAAAVSEWTQLQGEVTALGNRIGKLDEAVHALESGLDVRLSKLASSVVSGSRAQMESTADAMVDDLATRGTKQLEDQLCRAEIKLGMIQKEVENAAYDSLRESSAMTAETFEISLHALAQKELDHYRDVLTGGFHSLLRALGEQFQLKREHADEKSPNTSPE